ncbi:MULTISPECIES: LytR/AlgR family response regulator transcription factor [Bizionia]|nr:MULTISPECIES: LytTR family DNA-binding domain-containing protein [Bizionia]OBX24444.1 hypothetical protein BAA08_00380 [Bizionia sp. APA-3]
MKVLIIEDELLSSRRLERMVSNLDCEILASFVSVKKTVSWLQNNKHPDVLFLDIQLSDGLCFEIFDQVDVSSAIVFTTAFSDYSLEAFDYNSLSYLLKPINMEKLEIAVQKAKTVITSKEAVKALRNLIQTEAISQYKNTFPVKIGTAIKIIDISEISCFYSLENSTYIHAQGANYIINYSLSTLVDILNPQLFFQISRKCIINKKIIKSIKQIKNGRLQVIAGSFTEFVMLVSRERAKHFKAWLE